MAHPRGIFYFQEVLLVLGRENSVLRVVIDIIKLSDKFS
jgi:hypothetical protein